MTSTSRPTVEPLPLTGERTVPAAAALRAEDGPFGQLDARALASTRLPASNFAGH